MLLDKGTANVVCKAVEAEEGLEDDIHVASVTQVGEPVWGVSSKEKRSLAHTLLCHVRILCACESTSLHSSNSVNHSESTLHFPPNTVNRCISLTR